MSNNTITDLRAALFDTLRDLKAGKIDIDHAKAINETAQVIVNTAKIEIDHMKVAGGSSVFIADNGKPAQLTDASVTRTQHGDKTVTQINGATVTRHKMR